MPWLEVRIPSSSMASSTVVAKSKITKNGRISLNRYAMANLGLKEGDSVGIYVDEGEDKKVLVLVKLESDSDSEIPAESGRKTAKAKETR